MKRNIIIVAVILAIIAFFIVNNKKDNQQIKIGILQFVQHEALDEAREGFIERLKEQGYVDGQNIKLDYQNASGDTANTATIAKEFEADNKNLILAIATPAAQSLATKINDKPILITAVTDPATAGLVKSNENVGGNVTGTSDKAPADRQAQLLKKLFPNVKKVGVIYSSAEDNSKFLVANIKDELAKVGIEIKEATVQNSNDIMAVTNSLVGVVDAIYLPTDNVVSSSIPTIVRIANENKIITLASEPEQVKNGALFTIGLSYRELGKQTADMAIQILQGKKEAKDMPIEYIKNLEFFVNENTANQLGLNVDEIKKAAKNE